MKTNHTPQISVIGAGIMGLTCAYVLAQRFGQNAVRLYDAGGFPADNASFMAGGMLAPYSELEHMPPSFLPAGLKAISFWKDFAGEAGSDLEFQQNGSLHVAHESDRHLLTRFQSLLPSGVGSVRNIVDMEKKLALKFAQGLLLEGEAHLNPQKVMNALCGQIQRKESMGCDPVLESRQADWVIDCRGLGAAGELRGVKGEILIVRNPEFSLDRPVRLMHPRYPLYIVPRADHVFMIGATIIESGDNKNISLRSGLELMSALFSLHPSFSDAEIITLKSGTRPAYADNLPHIHIVDNIISCNGLYRHGYLLSPVMAKCVEALILNQNYNFMSLFLKDNKNADHIERKSARA